MEKFLIESGTLKTYIMSKEPPTIDDYGKAILKKKPRQLGELMMARRLSDGQEWYISSKAVCQKIDRWKKKMG